MPGRVPGRLEKLSPKIVGKFQNGCSKFLCRQWSKPEHIAGEIRDFRRDEFAAGLKIKVSEVPSFVVSNWTAPCLIPVQVQDGQNSMPTWAMHDSMQSVAAVLGPVFTYSKGKLHLEETKRTGQLSRENHNLYHKLSVLLQDKVDERDLRPMSCPCRAELHVGSIGI